MKTRSEVDELIRQWEQDPHWDIEFTEGFEDYWQELTRLHTQHDMSRMVAYETKMTERALEFGCSVQLVKYIDSLERRLKALEGNIEQ